MSALRKPTAELEATGAYEKHPERRHQHEPNTGRGVGAPPDELSAAAKKAWDAVVADCAPGVFQSSDRVFLGVLAEMVGRFWQEGDGYGVQRTVVLLTFLRQAGMTPSSRSHVMVPKQADDGKPKSGLASFR
jgi:phage terminase small subunit